ncbi:putative solute-binding protein [Alcanivorax sp. IL3]|jgi:solute-binding AdeT-like protein|uniref:putative solute-binding protein n=1 Tax=Alcanivorax TaxID=59753 RepID=UPI00235770EF|nr:putative solute-binding protein [Alcanivorax jadensis]
MRYLKAFTTAATAALALTLSPAQAAEKRSMCVFDIIGANGDIYNIMKDYKTAALGWGVDLELKPYTDEKIASEDLKAGQCDAAVLTGIRGRQFNNYTGSLDSIGAIPSYDAMRTVITVLASGNPSINEKLVSGPYEVGGVAPMGAAYLFVKDRTIDTVSELSGKSIAVLEYDSAQASMASRVGMSPVMSDITNFSGRFNNGSVDICFAPIAAYSALELYKGMQPDGGMIDYVLGQLTAQVILKKDRFPDGYADSSRKYMLGQFDRAMTVIENANNEVDKKWWIRIPEADKLRYDEMMREARIALTNDGVYSKDMMSLLRKVRCKEEPSRAECVNPVE